MFALCFCALLCVLSSFAISLIGIKRAGCFILLVFLVACGCYCSVVITQSTVG